MHRDDVNDAHPTAAQVVDNETLIHILESHARRLKHGRQEGQEADLSLLIISDFDFSNLSLSGIHISGTTFHRCCFQRTDLYGVVFDEIAAPAVDFGSAVLAKAEFYDADLRDANFDGANIVQTFFLNCDLRGATFRGADLADTSFSGSNIEGAVFDQPVSVG